MTTEAHAPRQVPDATGGPEPVEPDRTPPVDGTAAGDDGTGDGSHDETVPSGLSWGKVAVLAAALAFLGGAIGYTLAQRDRDPLSSTDVGFLQDMNFHHVQAVQMSLILLDKTDIDASLRGYAQEILSSQRFEQGIFNATLDRFDHPSDNPKRQAMGWMGPTVPRRQMEGLATSAQMTDLRNATGKDAEALYVALMSEHHLGGIHMADWEARHGKDRTVKQLALAIVQNQRNEVIELDQYRKAHDVGIPKGFEDPRQDPRLNPASLSGG